MTATRSLACWWPSITVNPLPALCMTADEASLQVTVVRVVDRARMLRGPGLSLRTGVHPVGHETGPVVYWAPGPLQVQPADAGGSRACGAHARIGRVPVRSLPARLDRPAVRRPARDGLRSNLEVDVRGVNRPAARRTLAGPSVARVGPILGRSTAV